MHYIVEICFDNRESQFSTMDLWLKGQHGVNKDSKVQSTKNNSSNKSQGNCSNLFSTIGKKRDAPSLGTVDPLHVFGIGKPLSPPKKKPNMTNRPAATTSLMKAMAVDIRMPDLPLKSTIAMPIKRDIKSKSGNVITSTNSNSASNAIVIDTANSSNSSENNGKATVAVHNEIKSDVASASIDNNAGDERDGLLPIDYALLMYFDQCDGNFDKIITKDNGLYFGALTSEELRRRYAELTNAPVDAPLNPILGDIKEIDLEIEKENICVNSVEEEKTERTLLDLIPELINARQEQMHKFLVAGEKKAARMKPRKSYFQHNPRMYCNPLFNALKPPEADQSRRLYASRKCASRFGVDDLALSRVRYSDGEAKQQSPINVIKFDKIGALFAVGGSNGVVRIFDFDECLLKMLTREAGDEATGSVSPVVSVDTRRAVSDVAWSIDYEDELCVCFAFRSDIYIYDLQDLSEPRQILTAGKAHGSPGHNKALYMPFQNTGSRCKDQCIVAGSKSGHVRKWDINKNIVCWEMLADAVSSGSLSNHRSSVIGLAEIERKRLVSLTQSGTLVLWDLEKMTVPSFGCESVPTMLAKMHLPNAGSLCAVGMTFVPTFISEPFAAQSRLPLVEGNLVITLGSGDVEVVAVEELARLASRMSLCTGSSKAAITILNSEYDALASNGAVASALMPCTAIVPPFLQGRVCCTSDGPSLRFFEMGDVQHSKGNLIKHAESLKAASSSAAAAYAGITTSISARPSHRMLIKVYAENPNFKLVGGAFKQTGLKIPPQIACPSFTLPGQVVSVEHGGREVVVSKNLQSYLAIESIASSSPSRSHEVYLDWSRAHVESHGADRTPKLSASQSVGAPFVLTDVQPYVLMLSEPYLGPSVVQSHPRVYIRTNLAPGEIEILSRGERASRIERGCNFFEHQRIISQKCFLAQCDIAHREGRSVALSHVTATACHSSLPFLITGHADDSVRIIGQPNN